MKHERGTGGGLNQSKYLSANDKCIYDLIGMKESVEGVENCQVFGTNNNELQFEAMVDDILSKPTSCQKQSETPAPKEPSLDGGPTCSSGKQTYSIKQKIRENEEKLTTTDLLSKESKSQENLCLNISKINNSTKKYYKEHFISFKSKDTLVFKTFTNYKLLLFLLFSFTKHIF